MDDFKFKPWVKGKSLFTSWPDEQTKFKHYADAYGYKGPARKLGPPDKTPEKLLKELKDAQNKLDSMEFKFSAYAKDPLTYGRFMTWPEAELQKPSPPPVPFKRAEAYRKAMDVECIQHMSDGRMARERVATAVLWAEVVKSIEVRHPDATASISLSSMDRYSEGSFHIGADDTREPGVKQPQNFRMPWKVNHWPGQKVAEMYFVCAWMTYLGHEATELVSYRDRSKVTPYDHHPYPDHNRVINVHQTFYAEMHYSCKKHWSQMNAIMYAQGEGDRPYGEIVLTQLLSDKEAASTWGHGVINYRHEVDALVTLEHTVPESVMARPSWKEAK